MLFVRKPENIDIIILDGTALVNMIKPGQDKTFSQYAEKIKTYIASQLSQTNRLDIVWGEYQENSLKATTRYGRGTGVRLRVAENNPLPKNWSGFLRADENKKEHFKFLAEKPIAVQTEKIIITSYGQEILTNSGSENGNTTSPMQS